MVQYLHQCSDLIILAVVLLVLVGFAVAAPDIGKRIFGLEKNAERDDAVFDAFKAIMSMTGVVLAFSLVQATTNLRGIETTVSKEAAVIAAVDRILLRIDIPKFAAMRPLLTNYGHSVVKDEWLTLEKGQDRSAKTDAAYTALSKAVRAESTNTPRQQAMYSELLKNLDDIADYREQIIADAELSLPDFFWTTIAGLFVIGFVLASMTNATLNRRAGLAATTAAVALLLAFVIIIDVPFEGETSVSPHAIESVLQINDHRS